MEDEKNTTAFENDSENIETSNFDERPERANEPQANANENTATAASPSPEESSVTDPNEHLEDASTETTKPVTDKRRTIIIALTGIVLIIIGALAYWYLVHMRQPSTSTNLSTVSVQLMGGEANLIDGSAEVSANNKTWQKFSVGDSIKQGKYYRTNADGRLIIALDDGSAIRLNTGTTIKLDRLSAKNILVTNISGEVYTRIVKSDRIFTVSVASKTYRAMGTAYKTINTDSAKGVEVYESTVKVQNQVDVAEGKYYYDTYVDTAHQQKVEDIPSDKLKQDAFILWNYEQDKKSTEFKNSLGYLKKIDETTPAQTTAQATTTTASIALNGSKTDTGIALSWTLNNVSVTKGFKVVKGTSANPSYGKDDAVFVDANSRSYKWKISNGGTYHFRVCLYGENGCSLYSNDISVTAPVYSVEEPSGSVSLSRTSGANFAWTLNGGAPYGFKLVWSKNTGPTYPNRDGDKYAYYSDAATRAGAIDETSGTFYVRVCLYTSTHTCTIYSNELGVTL